VKIVKVSEFVARERTRTKTHKITIYLPSIRQVTHH